MALWSSTAVAAAPVAQPSVARESQPLHWYGFETLAADSLSLGVLGLSAAGSARRSCGACRLPAYAAGLVFVFTGPVVHMTRGSVWRTFSSFGLRATAQLAGAKMGRDTAECDKGSEEYESCLAGPELLGVFVGASIASAIDASLLSWEPESGPTQPAWVPSLRLGRRDATLTVSGRW